MKNTRDLAHGAWLGELEGLVIREPETDADGPVLELQGDAGMAAVEVTNPEHVRGLTEASAEIKMELER